MRSNKVWSRGLRAGVLAAGLALAPVWAVAQTFTGGVRGTVQESGGIVPGVTVQLVNEETGATRDAVSNELGAYNFAAVPPGNYTVRAALAGFRTHESRGVRVAAQQFVTLDITLEVGALEETVTVTGAAPLIDTSNATGGGVINSQQLEALPSGGRSAFLFAVTLPTVVATGDSQFNRQQDQTNASLLSLGGGTFNIATKSGTNAWRGSGFYQTRPRWGSANNFFADRTGVPKHETFYHLAGGGFGGPIARNRTFFWYAQEGYRSNTTRNGALRFPTTRERMGDFSQSFNAPHSGVSCG
jgi:hypothetical protein